jgi:UDPglucose 6-dehydrogenase
MVARAAMVTVGRSQISLTLGTYSHVIPELKADVAAKMKVAGLAEDLGVDVAPVLEGIGHDPRIGHAYMRPSYGFGGSCLPKEVRSLTSADLDRGLPMHLSGAISDANADHQRRPARRIADAVGGLPGKRIAFLGLAFKADTDDVRSSPALRLAARLLAEDADLRAHDPAAGENARRVLPDLVVVPTVEEALQGADAAVIATEWPAYRDVDWARCTKRCGAR